MKKNILRLFVLSLLFCFVQSGVAEDDPIATSQQLESLRDIKAPVYFPANIVLILLVSLGIIAGAFFVWNRFFRKKKNKTQELPVDIRKPWEIAYEQFDELAKSSLLEERQFKSYYSRLSDIVRQYFENQFGIKAPEMTTEEFLWSLENSNDLKSSQKSTLKKFLNSCDIVKFAKYVPEIKERQESFQLARDLIDETREPSEQSSINRKPNI